MNANPEQTTLNSLINLDEERYAALQETIVSCEIQQNSILSERNSKISEYLRQLIASSNITEQGYELASFYPNVPRLLASDYKVDIQLFPTIGKRLTLVIEIYHYGISSNPIEYKSLIPSSNIDDVILTLIQSALPDLKK